MSMVRFATLCDRCGKRSDERFVLIKIRVTIQE